MGLYDINGCTGILCGKYVCVHRFIPTLLFAHLDLFISENKLPTFNSTVNETVPSLISMHFGIINYVGFPFGLCFGLHRSAIGILCTRESSTNLCGMNYHYESSRQIVHLKGKYSILIGLFTCIVIYAVFVRSCDPNKPEHSEHLFESQQM